jgi:hypothetical protein
VRLLTGKQGAKRPVRPLSARIQEGEEAPATQEISQDHPQLQNERKHFCCYICSGGYTRTLGSPLYLFLHTIASRSCHQVCLVGVQALLPHCCQVKTVTAYLPLRKDHAVFFFIKYAYSIKTRHPRDPVIRNLAGTSKCQSHNCPRAMGDGRE